LTLEFERKTSGDCVVRFVRADGSSDRQRHTGARAVFFAYHDLTHLAVERTLKLQQGFYGLIAAGWSVRDTEGLGPRGALPMGTAMVEHLVGLFDREQGAGTHWSAAEIEAAMHSYALQHGHATPTALAEGDMVRVRKAVAKLHAAWRDTAAGGVLRQSFPA